jgi:hypothetical protein
MENIILSRGRTGYINDLSICIINCSGCKYTSDAQRTHSATSAVSSPCSFSFLPILSLEQNSPRGASRPGALTIGASTAVVGTSISHPPPRGSLVLGFIWKHRGDVIERCSLSGTEKMMETEYRHTQFGALMFVVFLVTGVLIVVVTLAIIAESRWGAACATIGLYLLGLALFHSFTVEISRGRLKFWFGIGVIRKSYLLSEIQSAQEVDNPWYYLWGVKSIPGGWLYAIAPGTAVEIMLKNGKTVRLGTDQPELLRKAIDVATARWR